MNRINVVGTTGSGKSTVAASLAEIMSCPCIHLDQLYWGPNWQESPDDQFFLDLSEAISGDVWVLDGNYSRTEKLKFDLADTIIWLDFGRLRNFLQLLRRTIIRAWTKEELWPNTGNRESFKKSFFSKDSILLWYLRSFDSNRKKYNRMMHSSEYASLKIIRLRNPKQVSRFLEDAKNASSTP